MKKYISHESVLKYINLPLAQQYFEQEISPFGENHYTVFNPKDRAMLNKKQVHVCVCKLPKGSIMKSFSNEKLVSPSLMYIQLANKFDILQMIILGNLLCSRPNGPYSSPVVTKAKLMSFAKSATGFHGRKKALRALKYVQNDACSIMEIFIAMFLSLPHALGGLGLSGGVFNYELQLDTESSIALKKNVCFIDYCYPKEKIAYEYQGEVHSGTIDQDSSRILALKRLKFSVITITKSQLYDPNKLAQLLRHAAHIHKKNVFIRAKSYDYHYQRLRELLPRKKIDNDTIHNI